MTSEASKPAYRVALFGRDIFTTKDEKSIGGADEICTLLNSLSAALAAANEARGKATEELDRFKQTVAFSEDQYLKAHGGSWGKCKYQAQVEDAESALRQSEERLGVATEALEVARTWLKSEHFTPPVSCGACGLPHGNCDMNCVGAAAWSKDYGLIYKALSPTASATATAFGTTREERQADKETTCDTSSGSGAPSSGVTAERAGSMDSRSQSSTPPSKIVIPIPADSSSEPHAATAAVDARLEMGNAPAKPTNLPTGEGEGSHV